MNIESYRSDFFRKFFPKKFATANSINARGLKLFGNAVKKFGAGMKVLGKTLDVFGTTSMWYDILSAGSPTYWDDDAIKKSTRNELTRYILETLN